MEELKEIKVKFQLGGTPEGAAADWMTHEDWEKHRKYVENLKATGQYGKEVEVSLFMKPHPMLDEGGFILDFGRMERHEFKPMLMEGGQLVLKSRCKIIDHVES